MAVNPRLLLLLQHATLLLQRQVRLAAVNQQPASDRWRLLVQALQQVPGQKQQQQVLGRLQQRLMLVGLPSAGGWLAAQCQQQQHDASCRCSRQQPQVLLLLLLLATVLLLIQVARLLMVQARPRVVRSARGHHGSRHMQR